MKRKKALVDRDVKKDLNLDLQYIIEGKPTVFNLEKAQHITVNDRNAAVRIERYPEAVQKLVWRALYYKREIETRQKPGSWMWRHEDDVKLSKFIESFKHVQQLILKMCKRRNLRLIVIDGGA